MFLRLVNSLQEVKTKYKHTCLYIQTIVRRCLCRDQYPRQRTIGSFWESPKSSQKKEAAFPRAACFQSGYFHFSSQPT